MILRKGDMWLSGADIIAVTGNAYVKSNGELVMGRGAAQEAAQRYPGCAQAFGTQIIHWSVRSPGVPYGFVLCVRDYPGKPRLGLFQVKYNWWEAAKLPLIQVSARQLSASARGSLRGYRIALNFPGIGNGRLARESVLPLLQGLPNNVEVWEL